VIDNQKKYFHFTAVKEIVWGDIPVWKMQIKLPDEMDVK